MSTTTVLAALICAFLVAQASWAMEVALPRSVRVCNRQGSDYSSCLRLAIQESWMTFVKGIPELQLPKLDPMEIDVMETQYQEGEFHGRILLRDVKTYGLAKTNFLAVRPYFSGNTMNMEIDVDIPKSFVEGNYKAEGSIGSYNYGGKGYFNISMEGLSATWGLEGRLENDRWIIEHFHVFPEIEKMRVYFSDLFNGSEDLNKAALIFINEYWQSVYKGLLPTVEKYWDKYITDYVNQFVFSKVSVSKLFP